MRHWVLLCVLIVCAAFGCSALRAAVREDDDKASAELRSLEQLERDSDRMLAEAGQCTGGEIAMAQVSTVRKSPHSGFSGLLSGSGSSRGTFRAEGARRRARTTAAAVLAGSADNRQNGWMLAQVELH